MLAWRRAGIGFEKFEEATLTARLHEAPGEVKGVKEVIARVGPTLVLALILAACGGGESGVATPPPVLVPIQPPQLPTAPPQPSPDQVIGIEGGPIMTADKQVVGFIPQGAHKEAYSVSATVKSGRLSVERKPINGLTLDPVGPMTIFLPPGPDGTDFVPANPCPADVNPSLPECWTSGIISPAFFGDALNRAKHRLSRNELKTSHLSANIQVEYGAQLTSSEAPKSMPGRIPVLFVHGYILGGGFGGGDGTWASLPTQVRKLPLPTGGTPFVPFEFRWQTDASFITVANDLAQAVTAIHNATGSRVHIVAHSFGGLLARTLLQDISDATKGSPWSIRSKVMSLTTVGTPHSGILESRRPVESVPLPDGWNPAALDNLIQCVQISCYQSGIAPPLGLVDFVANDLSGNVQLAPPPLGYVVARLNMGINQSIVSDGVSLPILSLIGQQYLASTDLVFADGDGLISYRGQRFKHDETNDRPELLFETQTNFGFIVTERVLGFGVREGAFPGDSVRTAAARSGRSPYSNGLTRGYWHTPQIGDAVNWPNIDWASEVAVKEGDAPLDCSPPCHDTWANLREFLLSQHGGLASENFPTRIGDEFSGQVSLSERIFNFDLTAKSPSPPFETIEMHLEMSAIDPVSGSEAIVMSFYGGLNGSDLITWTEIEPALFQSGTTLTLYTANAIYIPTLDGQFSIGLRMKSGTAAIVSFRSRGGQFCYGCQATPAVDGVPYSPSP